MCECEGGSGRSEEVIKQHPRGQDALSINWAVIKSGICIRHRLCNKPRRPLSTEGMSPDRLHAGD